ncbi:cupin domain-containing protein [Halieaceae bacterium IMCC8485]|jgi:quercetin dioxygenase-like cupin family protein|uniref:Cupin domain-containing protein n=1 Tax=Candidatus Seongchinamella marina TaxID=2518990 RepID=A0ABT3STH6_9GAMM|nr:cupin domain-containing protein [Candidatus Seongchinamella marina]MCX2973288.1 cupin domain-containing protein [Candidatus Seongchinamella marina]
MIKYFFSLLTMLATTSLAAPLLTTTQSWDAGSIAYPVGQAEIASIVLHLEEGKAAPFHCHPVPTMGYVLQGTVLVETKSGKATTIAKGDALVEVMRTVHRGIAVDGPAELVVFYAGAEGIPHTVLPSDDPGGVHCDD